MLAIVIPYYKLTFFRETLDSLAKQTDKRFNVYIGDDASKESPEILLKEFKNSFGFEYQFFENNLGGTSLTGQWQRCIEMTKNEDWVMVLGDDDYLAENLVEEFYKHIEILKSESINAVRFSTYVVNDAADIISEKHQCSSKIEPVKSFLFRNCRSSLSEYVFKLDKVKSIKFKHLPLGWYSDFLAVLEFSGFGKILNISETAAYIRISDLSITGSQNKYLGKNKAKFEFYHYLFKKYKDKFTKEEKTRLLSYWEKAYFNNRSNIFYFFIISINYLKESGINGLSKFNIKILKSLLK